nr:MAG TPA: hypothetical protein [Caudoviricetes sp.]DAO62255.1 MAG TPA: hypothetical protein [Caudoviricetes sp.]DAP27806.1 MAG TPA: hypothetical protein [Caudoviricetes sp.]DAX02572.1 MAG TPA: hypothetical protein [Bacteriophage sp.]DAZ63125.1 MAG TPA: hypothetical protein [Caudoviricetes sp.]
MQQERSSVRYNVYLIFNLTRCCVECLAFILQERR